jgi:hypothetical protein
MMVDLVECKRLCEELRGKRDPSRLLAVSV